MEAKIDAWLKTYLNEMLISPVDWEDLPEDCRIQLDNFARDEAVRRADAFANEGVLDLSHQDAIRQLVDAMAQAWKLPGDKVRQIVEDFYDALPSLPGEEFEKLAIRLYRRTQAYSWHEIVQKLDSVEKSKLVEIVIKHADLPADAGLDKTSFLKGMRYSYDSWTLTHPKDAVNEAIETLDIEDESTIKLPDLLPLVQKRGASTWARALELELEVDVETASRDDLIRILKRYSLIVRREGGLQPPKNEQASGQVISAEIPKDPEPEVPDEPDDDISRVAESAVDSDPVVEEDVHEEVVFTPDLSTEDAPDVAFETEDSADKQETVQDDTGLDDPTTDESSNWENQQPVELDQEDDEPSSKEEPLTKELTAEDKDALDSMFGEAGDEDLPDVARSYWEEQEEGSGDHLVNEPHESLSEEVESPSDDPEAEKVEEAKPVAVSQDPAEEIEEEGSDQEDEEDEEDDIDESGDDEPQAEESSHLEEEEPKKRLQDVFVPSPQGDDRDRFANLRSGDLREKIVREMYDGDSTMLDVFLAKLSGAPDWNRAKQFIANEFFRCKLDLHSELGEQFFLVLKESLRD